MKPVFLMMLCLAAGCAAPTRTINIESTPPGARVFYGIGPNATYAESSRQYLGKAPLQWTTIINRDGTFKFKGGIPGYSMFVQPVAVFFAEPDAGSTNLFAKRQLFRGKTLATPADEVPNGIYFDLTRP